MQSLQQLIILYCTVLDLHRPTQHVQQTIRPKACVTAGSLHS